MFEEEALFARDLEGWLVRVKAATLSDYEQMVDVTFVLGPGEVDQVTVQVPKAVPSTDAQGVYVRDKNGETIPRATTIIDADRIARDRFGDRMQNVERIPTLCHQEHMDPVGVCRVCAVHISRKQRDGSLKPARRLVPACQHRVEDGMVVRTIYSQDAPDQRDKPGERVRQSVRTLVELLLAKNYHPDANSSGSPRPRADAYHNELEALARRLGVLDRGRQHPLIEPTPILKPADDSSPVILVDHNHCILCTRCVRACNEVKPFEICGRTGKGRHAAIGFDLNDPMGTSGCVACGECMISCPTGALTFKKPITRDFWLDEKSAAQRSDIVPTEELIATNELFRNVPYSFLKWNEGAVLRRRLDDGHVLCRQNEYGTKAFIIEDGQLDLLVDGKYIATLTKQDVILGEMACMNNQPRSATVQVRESAQVLEIDRNILFILQRNYHARTILNRVYGQRALDSYLRRGEFSQALNEEEGRLLTALLADKVKLIHVDPGVTICREGEAAQNFYIVRLGHVKVYRGEGRNTVVLNYLRQGHQFGEIAFLTGMFAERVIRELPASAIPGRRTASCEALDHVELVRIKGEDFKRVLSREIFDDVRHKVGEMCAAIEDNCIRMLRDDAVRQRQDVPLEARTLQRPKRWQALEESQVRYLLALLGDSVETRHHQAGAIFCHEGDTADEMYILRDGVVEVFSESGGQRKVYDTLGIGCHLGELALLSGICERIRKELPPGVKPGQRTASCRALEDIELICIPGKQLQRLFNDEDAMFAEISDKIRGIRKSLEDHCIEKLKAEASKLREYEHPLNPFLDQGIYQGQQLLVLDLESCTRCDECTKACVDSHNDGYNRLTRDGLRFEHYLVATACRSCHDPVCLIGCPVDSIHRSPGKHELAIVIEDHCIGCGLCAHNCPFGNIKMADPDPHGRRTARIAVTCDQCETVPGHPGPMCVHACPHDAAHRMGADKFLELTHPGRKAPESRTSETAINV